MKKSHNYFFDHKVLLAVTTAALSLGVGPAFAQSADEEIIVTARKREESLQKVPVAVTAFSGQQLAEQGLRGPSDLTRVVPSLTINPTGTSDNTLVYSLRGQFSAESLLTIDQAVGVYYDGVNIPRARGTNTGFFDLERVEVLKGPQGTLYGRNTTGGAINYVSKGADYEGIHGFASAELGTYNDQKFGGAINLPIVNDVVAVRLAYQHWNRDGFIQSRITGQDFGRDKNEHFFRGTLRVDPSDDLSIEVKGNWSRQRSNGYPIVPVDYNVAGFGAIQAAAELGLLTPADLPAIFAGTPTLAQQIAIGTAIGVLKGITAQGLSDPFTTDIRDVLFDNTEAFTLGGTLTWQVSDNVQLKSITGLRQFTSENIFDLDATRFQFLEVGVGTGGIPIAQNPGGLSPNFSYPLSPDQHSRSFTQEINVSGTGLDERLNWLGGVFYSTEQGNDVQSARAVPFLSPISFLNDGSEVTESSWSVYSQEDFKITDDLTITFGGRYTEERHGLASQLRNFDPSTGVYICGTGLTQPDGPDPDTLPDPLVTTNPAACTTRRDDTFTGFSWLASLNYQLTDDTLVYIKTARGFRGGAEQVRAPTVPPAAPEFARDVEIGLKSDWFDHKLRTNVAAYTTKYSNKQESIILTAPSGNLLTILQNAAQASIKGVEAEVTARPFEGFTLNGAATYYSGKYKSFPTALSIVGAPFPGGATGEKFSDPKWTYSLSGRYEFPLLIGVLGTQLDWAYTGHAHPSARNLDPALPASLIDHLVGGRSGSQIANGRNNLGLLNARVDYDIPDYGVTLSFFMTNVLDKTYQIFTLSQNNTGGIQAAFTGEPRMWGFVIRKSFGEGE